MCFLSFSSEIFFQLLIFNYNELTKHAFHNDTTQNKQLMKARSKKIKINQLNTLQIK